MNWEHGFKLRFVVLLLSSILLIQLRLHGGCGDPKNHDIAAEIMVANWFLKPCLGAVSVDPPLARICVPKGKKFSPSDIEIGRGNLGMFV